VLPLEAVVLLHRGGFARVGHAGSQWYGPGRETGRGPEWAA
jgi:hypothetical protein